LRIPYKSIRLKIVLIIVPFIVETLLLKLSCMVNQRVA
jgi:hypothetical protein